MADTSPNTLAVLIGAISAFLVGLLAALRKWVFTRGATRLRGNEQLFEQYQKLAEALAKEHEECRKREAVARARYERLARLLREKEEAALRRIDELDEKYNQTLIENVRLVDQVSWLERENKAQVAENLRLSGLIASGGQV